MGEMTISDLYDKLLSDKEFQDPATGNLFFPAYIYTYDPEFEYDIREQILDLKPRLKRPNNFVDTLILNVFDEFINFLSSETLGDETVLELILQQDIDNSLPEHILKLLIDKANSLEFFEFINKKALKHFKEPSKLKKVYLMLYGFGSIFPFLRTSSYLKNFEQNVKDYKLIAFFPGYYKNQNYHLFNEFHDENIYRATLINP
jgi:hypothetical protein